MVWRLLADDRVGAADGLATDEALMHHFGRGEPGTGCEAALRLYTYRSCALVGRYQMLDAEVDLDACRERGLEVGRRATGGGAILMGPGQLGVAVTTRAPSGIGPRDLLEQYAAGIIAGLAHLGVDARFRGKNDLEVDGRKVAGLGLYVDDCGALLFHSSILADLDIELMLEVLRIPGAKLQDKGVARVQERVTTVSRETGLGLLGADLRGAVAEGFRETLGIALQPSEPDDVEQLRAAELVAQRYASPDWLAGRQVAGDARGTAMLKTPEGFLRVYAGVQRDALSSVLVSGDFSAMPEQLLALEAALRWCRADPARIEEVVRRQLDGDDVLGVGAGALAGAVWGAAERALVRAGGAAPVRAEGSCYFPDREVMPLERHDG